MKKRILSAFMALLLAAVMLAGCSSGGSEDASSDAAGGEYKFALVVQGSINDGSWCTSGYNGLMALQEEYGVETSYTEAKDPSEFEETFRNYATLGFNVIIGHGAQFFDAAKTVAAEFPDTIFIVNSTTDYAEPNVAGVIPGGEEMGLICGVIAAQATGTKKIGAIGGSYGTTTIGALNGFAAGALSIDPDIDVTLSIIDTWSDAAKAKEQALAMIASGCDIILSNCDSAGLGVYEACQESGIYCIPTYGEQNDVAPDNVIFSGLCDAGMAMKAMGDVIIAGGFEAKAWVFGVADGCAGYAPNAPVYDQLITGDEQKAIDEVYDKIANGEVSVEEYIEQYVPEDLMLK